LTILVNVKNLSSEPAVTAVCSSAVLCFYCHWLCSTDIAFGFVGLMLKDNRMNRLTIKVWQLLRRFSQNGRLL